MYYKSCCFVSIRSGSPPNQKKTPTKAFGFQVTHTCWTGCKKPYSTFVRHWGVESLSGIDADTERFHGGNEAQRHQSNHCPIFSHNFDAPGYTIIRSFSKCMRISVQWLFWFQRETSTLMKLHRKSSFYKTFVKFQSKVVLRKKKEGIDLQDLYI